MNGVERAKALCKERKIPISKLEKDLGFANGYIGQLKRGVFPTDRAQAIAQYFNVSIEEFLGSEQKEKPLAQGEELDAVTMELKTIWESADDDEKAALLEMARLIKKRRAK